MREVNHIKKQNKTNNSTFGGFLLKILAEINNWEPKIDSKMHIKTLTYDTTDIAVDWDKDSPRQKKKTHQVESIRYWYGK